MQEWMMRTGLLLGEEALSKLSASHLLVIGLGGVGAYAAELAARAGIGEMTIIDGDIVNATNINRQLPATIENIGKSKALVMEERLKSINAEIRLNVLPRYLDAFEIKEFISNINCDFIIDAIDTIAPKLNLIESALERKIGIISSMGAGGRMDVTSVKYADISKTEHCALARSVRRGLRERGIKSGVMTVFSTEDAVAGSVIQTDERDKRTTVGTVSFLPAVFGCYLAAYAIKKLTGIC